MQTDTMNKAPKTEDHPRNGVVERPALTFELVSQLFSMPIHQAARELNMGQTALKKRCRELGIPRWPGRKMKSLQKLIDDVKELGKDDTPDKAEKTKMAVQMLQQCKKLVEERPDIDLDEETKMFRQAVWLAKYKIRQGGKERKKLSKALHA